MYPQAPYYMRGSGLAAPPAQTLDGQTRWAAGSAQLGAAAAALLVSVVWSGSDSKKLTAVRWASGISLVFGALNMISGAKSAQDAQLSGWGR